MRRGDVHGVDRDLRRIVGDPTASDLQTVKAIGGFTITEMEEIMLRPRRTIQRQLKGTLAISAFSFNCLLNALRHRLTAAAYAGLEAKGGARWWTRSITLSPGPDGRAFAVFN